MAKNRPWPKIPTSNREYTTAAVLIVGGGISGICTAIDMILRNNSRNFIIIEKSNGFGGTWKDNTYPGCCCDVESVLYSYSFEQRAEWSRIYPGQEEILDYLISTAQKYDLFKHVRFNTVAEEARWDDTTATWKTRVRLLGGKEAERHPEYTISSSFLVTAIGQLNRPSYPEIVGMDKFRGKTMHSARWDWSYDLAGKKVAVIGNGCTAAQIIPEVAKVASKLVVFQRTPAYIIPRYDAEISDIWQTVYKYIPLVRSRVRARAMDFRETVIYNAVKDTGTTASNELENMAIDHLKTQLAHRPDLWDKLTPKYPVGCKRTIISSDFYPALGQEHAHLETRRVLRMNATGIEVDGEEEHEFDVIVFATGFQTTKFFQGSMTITGAEGRNLEDIWRNGPRALYGITVESLPNFAMLYGPNTNLGHNSIVLMIEAQSRYINGLISAVLHARITGQSLAMSPNKQKLETYNASIQKVLGQSSYAHPSCSSWYKNADGTITQNWSGTVVSYQKLLAQIDWSDYDISGDGTAANTLRNQKTTTYLGRVVEETTVSYTTMGLLAGAAVVSTFVAAIALRPKSVLRFWSGLRV